jgi:hypothetical protein
MTMQAAASVNSWTGYFCHTSNSMQQADSRTESSPQSLAKRLLSVQCNVLALAGPWPMAHGWGSRPVVVTMASKVYIAERF